MQKFTKNNRTSACKSDEVTVFLIMFKLLLWTLSIIYPFREKLEGRKLILNVKPAALYKRIHYQNKFFLIKMKFSGQKYMPKYQVLTYSFAS